MVNKLRVSKKLFLAGVACAVFAASVKEARSASSPPDLSQWVVETARVHYTVYHPLHNVSGSSGQLEGYVRIDADGMHLSIVSAVTSFFSNNMSRDARLSELLDAAHFPAVRIRAFLPHFVLDANKPIQDVPLTVAITLHGVGTDVPIVAHVERRGLLAMHVQFTLFDSISAHGLARPWYWLWPVRDSMQIQGEIDLAAKPILEVQPKDEYSE